MRRSTPSARASAASTALRGGDVARVGRQHIRPRKNVIIIGPYKVTHDLELPAMEKTGEPIKLPVLPQLQAAIDAMGPANNLPFFIGPDGVTPLTTKRLRAILREAVSEAGLEPEVCDDTGRPKGLSGHGLRKHMAKKLAEEIGCSEHEIAAVLGHKDLRQVRTYTAGANKDQMAERALLKLLTKLAAEQPKHPTHTRLLRSYTRLRNSLEIKESKMPRRGWPGQARP
jgi:integrase